MSELKTTKLEYCGDYASYDCPLCYSKTKVIIKDVVLDIYWCAYCGSKLGVLK